MCGMNDDPGQLSSKSQRHGFLRNRPSAVAKNLV